MLLDIVAAVAGIFFGTLLERRILGQRMKPSLITGSLICLIGFIVGFATRGSALSTLSSFIVMLGVPAFSNGIWLLSAGRGNRKPI